MSSHQSDQQIEFHPDKHLSDFFAFYRKFRERVQPANAGSLIQQMVKQLCLTESIKQLVALNQQAVREYAPIGPLTIRSDFDPQRISQLNAVGMPKEPCSFAEPGSVFRYGSTGAYHEREAQKMRRGTVALHSGIWQNFTLPAMNFMMSHMPMAALCGSRDPIGQLARSRQ